MLVARELADLVMVVTPQVPEGHAKMVDQIVRAATGAEALIAEGVNRYSEKQKRQRFVELEARPERWPHTSGGWRAIGSSPRSNCWLGSAWQTGSAPP